MVDKLGKIHCQERLKKDFDSKAMNIVRDMVGYVDPFGGNTWRVTMLFEGERFMAAGQAEATIIANQEMIKGLLLQLLAKIGKK